MTEPLVLSGEGLTLDDLVEVADRGRSAVLSADAARRVDAARAVIDRAVAENRIVYGVTTGFGKFADVIIPQDRLNELQENLIRSHAAGVGEPVPERTVRALILLRANCLAKGHSGVRRATLETLLRLLEKGIHPVVPAQGSVGASGDLAPLAHLARALLGEGDVTVGGRRMAAADALSAAGITPVTLEAKEGLALINGTQLTTAIGGLALARLAKLAKAADLVAALTLDGLKGTDAAFDPRIHRALARLVFLMTTGSVLEVLLNQHVFVTIYGRPLYSYLVLPTFQGSGSLLSPLYYATLYLHVPIADRLLKRPGARQISVARTSSSSPARVDRAASML